MKSADWTSEERDRLIRQYNEWQDLKDAAHNLRWKIDNETPDRTKQAVKWQIVHLRRKGVIV